MVKKGEKLIYVAYASKRPYLPVAIADTVEELAEVVGSTKNTVRSTLCRARKGMLKNPRYAQVRI